MTAVTGNNFEGDLPTAESNSARRQQILQAAVTVISGSGYDKCTIREITDTAGVSRQAFYEVFEDKHSVLVSVLTKTSEDLLVYVRAATAPEEDWPTSLDAGLRAMLQFFADNPDLARITFVEAQIAGPIAMGHVHKAMRIYRDCLFPKPKAKIDFRRNSDNVVDQILGAVYFTIYGAMSSQENISLTDLSPQLMEIVLLAQMTPKEVETQLSSYRA